MNKCKSFDGSQSPDQIISEKGEGWGKKNQVGGKRALSLITVLSRDNRW